MELYQVEYLESRYVGLIRLETRNSISQEIFNQDIRRSFVIHTQKGYRFPQFTGFGIPGTYL